MIEVQSRQALQEALKPLRRTGRRVALVPTMGNLHAGHLSLVELASQHADVVIVSVFVNPTQFAPGEDFDRYPRTLAADRAALQHSATTVLFVPGLADVYPFGIDHAVTIKAPAALADRLCGASRPGHFDGVLTVVARLLLITAADVAVFGEKDYQQLLLIEHMCADLGFSTRIVRAPTVRTRDGLALSSRNQYLQPEQLLQARALSRVLQYIAERIACGERNYTALIEAGINQLQDQDIQVEYLHVVNADNLQTATAADRALRILVAARLPGARLIDNMAIHLE